jgi:prephenate dehydrogenase
LRIGIAGLGLIGGSLALALRERHEVTGYDVDEVARKAAAGDGIRVAAKLDDLGQADVVVVATPMTAIVPTLERLAAHSDGAVLLDTGSLKRAVADFASRAPKDARIVGGHPMAGTTSSGFSAADKDLFRGRPFLLVPTERSDDGAMSVSGTIARDCGATVTVCSAAVHDRAMARLLAAPLATAAALAVAGAEADPLLGAAGPGFRDSTRLAETPLDLAIELLFGSAKDTRAAIEAVIDGLEQLRDRLDQDDREYVRNFLRTARSVRDELG